MALAHNQQQTAYCCNNSKRNESLSYHNLFEFLICSRLSLLFELCSHSFQSACRLSIGNTEDATLTTLLLNMKAIRSFVWFCSFTCRVISFNTHMAVGHAGKFYQKAMNESFWVFSFFFFKIIHFYTSGQCCGRRPRPLHEGPLL